MRKIASKSRILTSLGRACDRVYSAMQHSAFGRALTAYDSEKENAEKSIILAWLSRLGRRLNLGRLKSAVMRGFDESVLLTAVRGQLDRLLTAQVRQYGVMLFSFGFYTILIYLVGSYAFPQSYAGSFAGFIVGVVCVLTSVPLMFSARRLSDALNSSFAGSILFFDVLGLRREGFGADSRHYGKTNLAFAVGMLMGLLTFVVDPVTLLIAAGALIAVCIVFVSPESGLLAVTVLLPFASARQLGYAMIFICLCYFLKVIRGKRSLRLELNDYAVLLFAFVILFGGVFSLRPSYSFTYAVKLFFYVLAYVITVNLITSRRWLSRIRSALIVSCIAAVLLGIVQKFAYLSPHIMTETLFAGGEVTALFATPEQLAQYIVLTGFFAIVELLRSDNTIRRLFLFFIICAEAVCLYYTMSAWAMLAFVVAFTVMMLIYSSRTLFALLAAAVILPIADYVLPPRLTSAVSELVASGAQTLSLRMPVIRASLGMARDNIVGGSGVGTFRILFPSYATEAADSAVCAHNVYLQTIIEVGIVGLVVFLVAFLLFVQSSFRLYSVNKGRRSLDSVGGLVGASGLLFLGLTSYIWLDERIFLAFWIVVGFSSAARRQQLFARRKPELNIDEGGRVYDI